MLNFSISVPRASYLACAFSDLCAELPRDRAAEVYYKETNSIRAVENLMEADYRLAVLRYQTVYEPYFRAMREAIRALGFADAEETAVGATIVKREYERILREEKPNVLISSCCHSVNLLIQKYFPAALPYLAPVPSPMQAHCADLKRRHPGAKTVFVGPCVAKKDEAERYPGIVDAVLTFEELSRWMADAHVAPAGAARPLAESRARLFPIPGGILGSMTIAHFFVAPLSYQPVEKVRLAGLFCFQRMRTRICRRGGGDHFAAASSRCSMTQNSARVQAARGR